MLGWFPDAYPDELLYSLSARYADQVHYPGRMMVIRELFGSDQFNAVMDFPGHLDSLLAVLPSGQYTLDQLIDEHTLIPYYSLFLPSGRLSGIREGLRGNIGSLIYRHLGISQSRIEPPKYLRRCPQCVEGDRRRFGEAYWHRVHQVPGVEICPIHATGLDWTEVNTRVKGEGRYEFISAERAQLHPDTRPVDMSLWKKPLLLLARDVAWLLEHRTPPLGLETIYRRYLILLRSQDLASYGGQVQTEKLVQQCERHFSSALLKLLGCEMKEYDPAHSWLADLVKRSSKPKHPLYHLLLMQFLGCSAEQFFTLPTNDFPFGLGPWPCLNPVCDHYLECVVQQCHIRQSSNPKRPALGIFTCRCGFSYTRVGPDQSDEDRWQKDHVKEYGSVWEARLKQAWEDKTIKQEQIAAKFGMKIETLRKHALRLGAQRSGCKANADTVDQDGRNLASQPTLLEQRRVAWLEAVQTHAHRATQNRRDLYNWLYRHDPVWLKDHLPPRPSFNRTRKTIVDWPTRDVQLSVALRRVASEIRTLSGPPIHVTLCALEQRLGYAFFNGQNKGKLPLTTQVLEEVLEPSVDFAVRRVWWVAERTRQTNTYLSRKQLLQEAGVYIACKRWPKVQEATEVALQMLRTLPK